MKATIVQVAGLALISLGVSAWFIPAGIIVAGLATVLFGLAMERK